jgi:hypothetical protein
VLVLAELAPVLDRPTITVLCSPPCLVRWGAMEIKQARRVHRRGRGRGLTPAEAEALCRDL